MTDSLVPPAPTCSVSTYSVVPYRDSNGILHCLYLDNTGKSVPPDQLNCAAQGGTVDFLCLQPLPTPVPANIRAAAAAVEGVTLFAAVAKTISDDDGLPNTYLADAQQRLVLPVMPNTRRATILIFSLSSAASGVTGLVATTDPEIKNSTDGTTG